MSIAEQMLDVARQAKLASRVMANLSSAIKNDMLLRMADALELETEGLIRENEKDVQAGEAKGLSAAMLDRLVLTPERIKGMADGLREVAALPDPVGEITGMWRRPNDIQVGRMRIPLGVIGIVFESRPNVTADAAGLCLKSGNAVVLRGGSEAIHSNTAIGRILKTTMRELGLPDAALQVVTTTDRTAVLELLKLEDEIDLIIPRGGEGLIRFVVEHSRIPVIKHYKGVCHTFVDATADFEMAEKIAINAKVQRPGVCNALETLLIHKDIAEVFVPQITTALQQQGVRLKGCETVREFAPEVEVATEEDWYAEYLELTL
ncbi:MAG TPA: glutamate-5-semialdehyde dehydrogenase, partial [Geothermobacteraceae bacterium]|nr:glutamate-5-semialdehyde dehydrogenase [Geothermobacteraceae bacterium]